MELYFLFHLRQIIEKQRTLPKSFDKIHIDSKTFQGQSKELKVRGWFQGHTFRDAQSQDPTPNIWHQTVLFTLISYHASLRGILKEACGGYTDFVMSSLHASGFSYRGYLRCNQEDEGTQTDRLQTLEGLPCRKGDNASVLQHEAEDWLMFDSEEKGSRFILRKTFLSKLLRSKRTARHGLDLVTWKSTHEPTRKPSILAVGIQSSQIGPNVLSGLFQMQLPRNLLLNDFPLC